MPCEPLQDRLGRTVGFLCSRGKFRDTPKTCYICGQPATKLCDYRDGFTTCYRPMCVVHTHHHGVDTYYCDEHNNEFSEARTRAEEKRLGLEE